MSEVKRVRQAESKGFRLTAKRKMVLEKVEQLGIPFDINIFTNPITTTLSVDEIIALSQNNITPNIQFQQNVHSIAQQNIQESEEDAEKRIEQINKDIEERFSVMKDIVLSTASGLNPALFISGSAGIGKSKETIDVVEDLGVPYQLVKGSLTPVGLYTVLYENRHPNNLLIFDDSDSVFDDEVKMNLLKACTDSSDERVVSWFSSRNIYDEDGNEVPSTFTFEGNIIFISNVDIYGEANGGSKMSVHYQALISRSFVMDLNLKTVDHYLARIRDVLFNSMDGYTKERKELIYNFMCKEKHTLRELSLRMIKKVDIIIDTYQNNWEAKAIMLLCKQR
jgi:hypothetical protein